ncbi:MAG: SdiA-regulated domain-containing protein [Ignavibacteriaceae bacterium]|nr:SdiA-regulated domain-containing protein [Ignavibacteriaceae bacterium]
MNKSFFLIFGIVALFSVILWFVLSDLTEKKSDAVFIELAIKEPSGLVIEDDTGFMWVISDKDGHIAKINGLGEIVEEMYVKDADYEGITLVDDSTLCIVKEKRGELVFISKKTGEVLRVHAQKLFRDAKSGIEGITFDTKRNQYYLVKEKDPGLLVTLDSALNVMSIDTLKYASDYSDIFYDKKADCLWISSDEDEVIFKCDINGKPERKIKTDIPKVEGISVNYKEKRIYFVSDELNGLFYLPLK